MGGAFIGQNETSVSPSHHRSGNSDGARASTFLDEAEVVRVSILAIVAGCVLRVLG
jgi:hypothetical protein